MANLAAQNNYFVAPTGSNDSNTNGSINTPWKTIQYGIDQLQPGDILNIRKGTYPEKLKFIQKSGTAENLTTIKAYNDEEVIVDGDSFNTPDALLNLWNSSFFRVEGIHFTNNYYNKGQGGIFVAGYGNTIEIINCKVSNISINRTLNTIRKDGENQPAIAFVGNSTDGSLKNILVSGTEVFNCNPGTSECLAASGNTEYFKFINNYIHNNYNNGIDASGHYGNCTDPNLDQARNGIIKNNICHDNIEPKNGYSSGIYIDGAKDIIVEHNTLYNNGYGAEIGCEQNGTTSNITFKNNIIYGNHKTGLAIGGYDENTTGKIVNATITNNTFYRNNKSNYNNGAIGELSFTLLDNVEISSNIFHLMDHNYLMMKRREQTNLTMKYNLVFCKDTENDIRSYIVSTDKTLYGLKDIINNTEMDDSNFFGATDFVEPFANNFRLKNTSKAIDSGNPNHITDETELDFYGKKRVTNNRIDCGADEYNAALHTTNYTTTYTKIYPNPATNYVIIEGILKNSNITLSNINGKVIKRYEKVSNSYKIDLKPVKTGIYFITISNTNNTKTTTHKVIKH